MKANNLDGDVKSLLGLFESIGDTCELGFIQRSGGIEPISLLRWLSVGRDFQLTGDNLAALRLLIAALRDEFASLNDPDDITILPPYTESWKEFAVYTKKYQLYGHTHRFSDSTTIDRVYKEYQGALPFLRDLLIRSLVDAEKIFVYRSLTVRSTSDIKDLSAALRAYGDNTLFYVVETSEVDLAGTAEWFDDNIIMGFMDKLGTYGQSNAFSYDCWINTLKAAAILKGIGL